MKIWNRIENHYFCLNAKSKFRYIVRKIGHPPLSLCIICIYFIHFYIYILCVWFKLVSILWCGFQIPIHPIEFLNFVCDLRVRTGARRKNVFCECVQAEFGASVQRRKAAELRDREYVVFCGSGNQIKVNKTSKMSIIQLTEYLLWKSIKHKTSGFTVLKQEFPHNK